MAAPTKDDKKIQGQEDVLEQIKNQTPENSLQFDPETGEFKIIPVDESLKGDPDSGIIDVISDRGWALLKCR